MRIPLSNDVVTVSSTVSTGDIIQAVGASVGHAKVRASLGVRSAANAKPTLELRSTCGDILGFAKLGWNGITIPSIDNEARALRELAPYAVTPFRAAGVIAEGTVQDRRFVVTEPMPIRVRDVPPRAHSLSASEARGPAPLVGMHPWSALAQVTSVVSTVFDDDQTTPPALAVEVRRVVDRILDQAPVLPAAGFWHGDFVCWNLARDGDGALWLFDWETAEEDVPAGMDTMHWYSNAQGPVDPKRTRERVAAAFETAKPVLRSMGYSSRTMRYLGAWYSVTLVARAIRLARALEGWERVALKPDTLAELLTWANQILDNATPQKEARR
ncbi:hypothetical protein [Microbacterium sp. RU33B]|uniref:hypothetical protein n=1 Tax=Microbacterium sp. RU33B TaxID=1907390 RepID=UPI00117E9B84|nr:hypothetical protein [Microbacterium sp. RU33B]